MQEVDSELYDACIVIARKTARELGYAIGVHGSQKRDLDLMAVPWTVDAVEGPVLVQAITYAINDSGNHAWFADHRTMQETGKWPAPAYKPHGRIAFTIILEGRGGEFIDISVMPLLKRKPKWKSIVNSLIAGAAKSWESLSRKQIQ